MPAPATRPARRSPQPVASLGGLAVLSVGCAAEPRKAGTDPDARALRDPRWPFPSSELVGADGQLDLSVAALPAALDGTPFPVERVAWRRGFSRVQTAVVPLPVAIDPASLPTAEAVRADGSVQLWDLSLGQAIPCMAELDLGWPLSPAALPEDLRPTLLIRPLRPMPVGAEIGVLITDQVRVAEGEPGAFGPLPRPQWFEAALAGEAVEGAFLGERIDVALDGERAGETEMFLDLAEHGGDAVFALVGVNEIEDLLLAVGEGFGHDVFT